MRKWHSQHSQHSQHDDEGMEMEEAKDDNTKEAKNDTAKEEMDVEEEEEKAFAGLKKRVVEDEAFEEENTVVERELFFDEKPLYDVFFTLVLGRCQDIVISIRGEATHVVYVVPCDG